MSTKSGKPPDKFIYEHFTKKEQVVKSKRWKVECKYCPGSVIVEHRDSRCLNHMINNCKNVPADAKREARIRLMKRAGIEIKIGNGSDKEMQVDNAGISDVASNATAESSNKRQRFSKSASPAVSVTGKRNLDAFLDRAMSDAEQDKSNLKMMRYTYLIDYMKILIFP